MGLIANVLTGNHTTHYNLTLFTKCPASSVHSLRVVDGQREDSSLIASEMAVTAK